MVPDFEASLEVPPVSTGIGEARRFTKEQLQSWGLDSLTDTAILLISELVTNAILHGGDGAVLTLVVADLKLRVEVRDRSPALPVVRGYSDTATTGRGMVIVDSLAAAWGSFLVEGGKVVWFELTTSDGRRRAKSSQESPPRTPGVHSMVSEFKTSPGPGGDQGGSLAPRSWSGIPVGLVRTAR